MMSKLDLTRNPEAGMPLIVHPGCPNSAMVSLTYELSRAEKDKILANLRQKLATVNIELGEKTLSNFNTLTLVLTESAPAQWMDVARILTDELGDDVRVIFPQYDLSAVVSTLPYEYCTWLVEALMGRMELL